MWSFFWRSHSEKAEGVKKDLHMYEDMPEEKAGLFKPDIAESENDGKTEQDGINTQGTKLFCDAISELDTKDDTVDYAGEYEAVSDLLLSTKASELRRVIDDIVFRKDNFNSAQQLGAVDDGSKQAGRKNVNICFFYERNMCALGEQCAFTYDIIACKDFQNWIVRWGNEFGSNHDRWKIKPIGHFDQKKGIIPIGLGCELKFAVVCPASIWMCSAIYTM